MRVSELRLKLDQVNLDVGGSRTTLEEQLLGHMNNNTPSRAHRNSENSEIFNTSGLSNRPPF